jgi:hypothetical protein
MREAVKLEHMVAEYNIQIARLKDRLLEIEKKEEIEEEVVPGQPNLQDSMQFSQIEVNLRNNTEGVENLVKNLKTLSIQAGCFT